MLSPLLLLLLLLLPLLLLLFPSTRMWQLVTHSLG
jgi:hypothetical protein